MKIMKYSLMLLLLTVMNANATTATLGIDPSDSGPFSIGDTFDVDIGGEYTGTGLLRGGAIGVIFDPDVVQLLSIDFDETFWSLGPDPFGSPIDFDAVNLSGTLDFIGFAAGITTTPVEDFFTIAILSFEAVGNSDASPLELFDPEDNIFRWVDSNIESVIPTFENGSITVAPVPLPAAFWFMASGIGFLVARSRKIV